MHNTTKETIEQTRQKIQIISRMSVVLLCFLLSIGIQQYAVGPVRAFQIQSIRRTRTNAIISQATSFGRRTPFLFAGRPGGGGGGGKSGGGNRRYQPKVEAKDANRPVMNNEITASVLRVVASSSNGKDVALGVLSKEEALAKALEMGGLDVILINANSDPPVVKIVDYSKYRYTLEKKAKEVKKNSKASELKEIKMSYKIDLHDYDVRKRSALKFIQQGNRVKCTVMFRGREMQHDKLGYELLEKLASELDTVCIQEGRPKREGRNLSLMLSPKVEVLRAVNEARKAAKKSRKKAASSSGATDDDEDDDDEDDDEDDDDDDDDDDEDYDDSDVDADVEVNGQKPVVVASGGGKVPKREKTLEEILGTDEYL